MFSDKIFELTLLDIHKLFGIHMESLECLNKLEALGGVKEICRKLKVDPSTGITNNDIEARVHKYGHNRKHHEKLPHFCTFLKKSLMDAFIIILLIASIFQIVLGASPLSEDPGKDWLDGIFILFA